MKVMVRCLSSSGTADSGRRSTTGLPRCARSYGRSLSKPPQSMPRRTTLRRATAPRKARCCWCVCSGSKGDRHERASVESQRTPLLQVNNVEVVYDHVILVLKGVSLEV